MAMQDVDFETKYQHRKDEQDPLDFLSNHPLPIADDDDTEPTVKAIIRDRPAVLLSKIKEETRNTPEAQNSHHKKATGKTTDETQTLHHFTQSRTSYA